MIVMQRRFSNVMVKDAEVSPTLEAGGGEGGNNLPMILTYKQYRYGEYVESDESATLRADLGKVDGGRRSIDNSDRI